MRETAAGGAGEGTEGAGSAAAAWLPGGEVK